MDFVWGKREMEETIEGVRFRVSPASFFQINGEMVASIFRTLAPLIARHAEDRRSVLRCRNVRDLLRIARRARRRHRRERVGRDGSARQRAAQRASKNACASCKAASRARSRTKTAAKRCATRSIVFLDPPRKGSDEATLAAIADANVPAIWYLSCNPATLARDLRYLAGARLHDRHRAAVRHVPANGPRRDARHARALSRAHPLQKSVTKAK